MSGQNICAHTHTQPQSQTHTLKHATTILTQGLSASDKVVARAALITNKFTKNRVKDLLIYFKLSRSGLRCKNVDGYGMNAYEVFEATSPDAKTRSFYARNNRKSKKQKGRWRKCRIVRESENDIGVCYTVKCANGDIVSAVNAVGGAQLVRPRTRTTPVRLLQESECFYVFNEIAPVIVIAALKFDRLGCTKYHTLKSGSNYTDVGSRRSFAVQVWRTFTGKAFGVTKRDTLEVLNVFFDRPGRVKETCAFYIDAGYQVSVFKAVLDDFDKDMDALRNMIDKVALEARQHCLTHEQAGTCMHFNNTCECVKSHVHAYTHTCMHRLVSCYHD